MRNKKFFVQVDIPAMSSQPCFYSSRNAAIRSLQRLLWWHDAQDLVTNAKSVRRRH